MTSVGGLRRTENDRDTSRVSGVKHGYRHDGGTWREGSTENREAFIRTDRSSDAGGHSLEPCNMAGGGLWRAGVGNCDMCPMITMHIPSAERHPGCEMQAWRLCSWMPEDRPCCPDDSLSSI